MKFQEIVKNETHAMDQFNALVAICELDIARQRNSARELMKQYGGLDKMPIGIRERCNNNLRSAMSTEQVIQAAKYVFEKKDDRTTYQSGLIAKKLTVAELTQQMREVLSVDDFIIPVVSLLPLQQSS